MLSPLRFLRVLCASAVSFGSPYAQAKVSQSRMNMTETKWDRVTVVGCGLIGASFALALRRAGACSRLAGWDSSPRALDEALSRGVIDEVDRSFAEGGVSPSDLIYLATPVGEIVAFLRERRPQVVVTFGPEGARNLHRDHRAISRAATAAFFLAGLETAYPEQLGERRRPHAPGRLWYVTWKTPPPDAELKVHGLPIAARVDVGAYLAAKRAAFEAHRTQHDHRQRFETVAAAPAEAFAFAAGIPLPATPADDLFAGL